MAEKLQIQTCSKRALYKITTRNELGSLKRHYKDIRPTNLKILLPCHKALSLIRRYLNPPAHS